MNLIWLGLVGAAILTGAFRGDLASVTQASFESAKTAVNLAIGLVGAMALWLGLVRIAENGGLLRVLARIIRPLMRRLFPDIPAEDPAMSSMVLNMAANALGMGNAATPLGIKAMMALNRLNPNPGTATDAMCLFLAINTSNVTLLPLGVITIRAAAGASHPGAILLPTLLATSCSTLIAIAAAKLFARMASAGRPGTMAMQDLERELPADSTEPVDTDQTALTLTPSRWGRMAAVLLCALFVAAMAWHVAKHGISVQQVSDWLVPGLILSLVCYGFGKGVPIYEAGVEGAKEGFQVAVRLIPFLVMILVAVGMFRASGAFELLASLLRPVTGALKIPVEVLPVALLRPLSGSGAFGLVSEITAQAPDSFAAFLAGVLQGSTETTFYVLAVYFGAAGVYKTRYAVTAALLADLAGFIAAVVFSHLFYVG